MNPQFCYYCMSPVYLGGSCPVCGLTNGTYEAQPHHLPPGTLLADQYLIGRVLGEGGFGITYLALDTRLDLKVAIKEYFPTDQATRHTSFTLNVSCYSGPSTNIYEVGKQRFLKEARTMAKMDKQPEVVGIRNFFEENQTAYIVMEYVDGTNFKDLVTQFGGRIPPSDLFPMIEPLFGALAGVHASGLVHRDISPDNLMLERGRIRLLDFGCAREASDISGTVTMTLKHGYSPVEQYTAHDQGPWTDIYALASTIYFCLTGSAPLRSTDRMLGDDLISFRQHGVVLLKHQEEALLKALSVKPRDRFQTMEEFYAVLYGKAEKPKESNLLLIALLILGAAAAVILIAVFWKTFFP